LSEMTTSPRIAVVGAGPAGLYASEILTTQLPEAQIDVLEALPTPFGLIRYGVAPDHPRIKSIVDSLHQILDGGRVRFWGNIKVGTDVSLAELHQRYDAVLLATGALKDAALAVDGVGLAGSFGGADFVSWYDAHPDYPQDWPLDAEQVAVIGNGNVALDVARVLARRPEDLAKTDMPGHVLERFRESPLTEIHVFGRRGPAAVKFSPLELRELGQVPGVQVVVDQRDFDFTPHDLEAIAANGRLRQAVKTLEAWRDAPPPPAGTPARIIHLHFFWRPERIEGEAAVTGLTVCRTRPDGAGGVVDTDELATWPVQAVYRAIGYFGSPVPGAPFDELRGVVPNVGGRVVDESGQPLAGLYATGWIKRGPVGLIGSTKSDALETVGHLVEDLPSLTPAADRSPDSLRNLLAARGVKPATWRDWLSVDRAEAVRGEAAGRSRVKFASREEMFQAAEQAA
jgi:ferredoxin--NADP+ reductase